MFQRLGMFIRSGAYQAGGVSSAVTPALQVGFTDTSGNRQQTTVVDNVTTVSGTAPFPVTFYGGDSVSTATDADTALEAFNALGFLFNFGEALGTTWSTTGLSMDTERGGPVAGHVFTTAGTFQTRMTCRDSAGNQAFIRVNFVISAPGAGTDMTSGVIPTFASNTVYNAPAGGTWGNIGSQLNGLHNVIIRKSGSGADPVFGEVTLDGRNEPTTSITRTRGVRFLNCNVDRVNFGNVGFDYCAFVFGSVGAVDLPNMFYAADQVIAQSMTTQQNQNVRMARGLFLHGTGTLGDSNSGYVLIGEIRELHLRGITLEKTSTAQHNVRGVFERSSIRNCIFNNTVAGSVSYFKFQGWSCTTGAGNGIPDAWPDTDMVVQDSPRRVLGLPLSKVCVTDCILGLSGSDTPDANCGAAPENNDVDQAQGCELFAMDYCVTVWTTQWYTADISGRYLAVRDYRLNNGAGALVNVAANTNHTNRVPSGWAGPTYTTGSRPVVVP